APHLYGLASGAELERVWACDASLYLAETCGGPQFLLAGDAASFIDPLSSYGVKKALASAWIAAVVVHTFLLHPQLGAGPVDFHDRWEHRVYAAHLRRVVQHACEAAARHPGPFWTARAETPLEQTGEPDERELWQDPDVMQAHERLRQSAEINLRPTAALRL